MIEDARLLTRRLIRFGIIGLLNVALTFSIFSLLVLFWLGPKSSIIVSGIVGILFSSLLNKSVTFGGRGKAYALAFIGVYVVTVGLNLVLIDYGIEVLEFNPILVQAVLVLPLAALTFSLLWSVDKYLKSPTSP